MSRALNPRFKQTQLLPAWPLEMLVAAGGPKTFCPLDADGARRDVASAAGEPAGPGRPSVQAIQSFAGHSLLGLLMFGVVFYGCELFATLFEVAMQWPHFNLWITQLLG